MAFDGWTSRNRLPLYGVVVFFLDESDQLQKLVLDIPEVNEQHTGLNIAERIHSVLKAFGTEDKMGYFTLDNASMSSILTVIYMYIIIVGPIL